MELIHAFADAVDSFTPGQGWGMATLVSLIAGLVMRFWRSARTLTGLALLGVLTSAIIFRERAAGVYLYGLAAFGYVRLATNVTRGRGTPARWNYGVAGLIGLTLVFLAQQITNEYTSHPIDETIGLLLFLDMLLLLRLLLFVWEFGVGRFDQVTVIEYLAWFGLPFTCLGPFLRYSEFRRQQFWEVDPLPPVDRSWWADATVHACMLVAGAAMPLLQARLMEGGLPGRLAVYYGTSPWGWYLVAAGYAGLLRLAGALGGVAVPVNYDSPFWSTSIAEFWSRWNMTVTSAFRDMLFFSRWGLAHPNVYLNTIVVFLAVGLWHAVNPYWILWGLIHGLGFCVFILWRKWRGPGAPPLPRVVGWGLTYVFVCSCWVLPSQLLKLAGLVGGH
jgi:hypothetical protein